MATKQLPQPASGVPVPPGSSNFNIKGSACKKVLGFADATFPGGTSAYIASLATEELRTFARQTFLAATWYDIFPIVPMMKTIAEHLEITFFDYVVGACERRAAEDLKGPHRLLLTEPQHGAILGKVDHIFRQFTDFGEVTIERLSTGRGRVIRSGVPQYLVPWIYPMTIGYAFALVASLRDDPERRERITMYTPEPTGKLHGQPVVTMAIEFPHLEHIG